MTAAPHAPAQLVEIRQPEAVGTVDDNGVRVRDVDATLDDGCAEQHICLARDEVTHDELQLRFIHLPVPDDNACARHKPMEIRSDLVDGLHTIMQEKDLPLAVQLPLDRLGDELLVVRTDSRLHRQTIEWRRVDGAHIPRPHQCHIECTRDGGSRQGQHVHHAESPLELLLVAHPETLLLIDDHQAQLVEGYIR